MFSIKGLQPDPIAQPVLQPRRWFSRTQPVLILTVLMAIAPARAELAYIIVDAMRPPPTARQPTWIALLGRRGLVHVPTGRTVVELEAGRYSIHHVDFGKSKYSRFGTIFISPSRKTRIDASADAITNVGLLQVESRSEFARLVRLTIMPMAGQLEWACHSHLELLARLPVRISTVGGKDRLVRVRCEAGSDLIREPAGNRSADREAPLRGASP